MTPDPELTAERQRESGARLGAMEAFAANRNAETWAALVESCGSACFPDEALRWQGIAVPTDEELNEWIGSEPYFVRRAKT